MADQDQAKVTKKSHPSHPQPHGSYRVGPIYDFDDVLDVDVVLF